MPIGRDGRGILYPEGPALRAVMTSEPAVAAMIRNDEAFVAEYLTPAIFAGSSPLTNMLLGQLLQMGLCKIDALRIWQMVLMGYVTAVNEFFMHDDCRDGEGASFKLPDLAQSIAKHGDGPEAVAAFLAAGGWPDASGT